MCVRVLSVCVCVCVCVRVYTHTHTHTRARVRARVRAHVRVRVHVRVRSVCVCVRMCVCMCVCAVCARMHVRKRACVCIGEGEERRGARGACVDKGPGLSVPGSGTPARGCYRYSDKTLKAMKSSGEKGGVTQKKEKKTKPNEPCPCGSGKKYKKCCMNK